MVGVGAEVCVCVCVCVGGGGGGGGGGKEEKEQLCFETAILTLLFSQLIIILTKVVWQSSQWFGTNVVQDTCIILSIYSPEKQCFLFLPKQVPGWPRGKA